MNIRLLFALGCIFFLFSAKAQKVTTQGKEFYVGFFPNGGSSTPTTTLYLASKNATTGTIRNLNSAYVQTFTIPAGGVTTVNVPIAECVTTVDGVISSKGLQVTSADTISAYGLNYLSATSDGTNIIQKDALGIEYVAAGYTPIAGFNAHLLIEATQNSTIVKITPKALTTTGNAAGVPFNVTLNQGQTYMISSVSDLSGSTVEVTNGCKPVAVFSGNEGARVPTTFSFADHLYEQLFPKTSWGKNFITATLRGRNVNRIRVYAGYNGTQVNVDGVLATTLAAGTFYEFETLNVPKFVSTSQPVEIMMFGVSTAYDVTMGPSNDGDPTMITISPVEQVLKDGIFLSPSVGFVTAHRVTIVCKTADAALTTLDGTSIGAGFTTVPGNTLYSTYSANIAAGQHRILNANGFIGYAYGFGLNQGYGFNVGSAVEKINSYFTINGTSIINAPVMNLCKNQPATFNAVSSEPIDTYTWDFGDGSAVVNTTGAITQQIHNYTAGGNFTVTLTSVRTSTNTCLESNTTISTFNVIVTPDLGADKTINVCGTTTTDLTTQYNTTGLTTAWTLGGAPVGNPAAVVPGNYRLVVSNGTCTDTAFVNIISNPGLPPAVSIAITSGNQTTCSGSSVTFTATPTNGGAAPAYQWQVNGINAGTNAVTFTTTTLANNDAVTVIMTSSSTCVTPVTATSPGITMTVSAAVAPAVTIAITTGSQAICAGTSVTFTATPTGGGTAPAYQWQVNGVNTGTNAATFTSTTLADNDVVRVMMTSNSSCASPTAATSAGITMTINASITPAVSIAITSGAQTICIGTSVTFTATPTNGGATPVYQWQVNGVNGGTNSATFTSATLANNDLITVVLSSSAACVSPATATSTGITMTVNIAAAPTVSIAITSGAQTICGGSSVTFTATPTNGGSAPVYQWLVNGANAGTNSNTFTSTTLSDGDIVKVILTSNANCIPAGTVNSNSITMTVNPNLTPTVSIAITNGAQTICAGSSVTFTATPTNGGTTPVYQWKVNGANAGTNAPTFTSATLSNNDVVTVVLTSNETCLATNNVVSNQITMTVNPLLTPSAAISASQTTICDGTSITFTATSTNGGTSPFYQWKINGSNAGANSPTFSVSTLANNDVVTVVLTSSETCTATNNVVSNSITVTVNPNLTPTINIAIPSSTVCFGAFAQFTATITNGGPAPSYQWKVNGANTGTNSPTFASATLISGDIISCIFTTSVPCYTALHVASNNIVITVAPIPVVTLTGITEILQGGYAQLHSFVNVANVAYNWTPSVSLDNPSIANPIASPDNTTLYRLEATSFAGCTGSSTILVKVVAGPQIANTFTPNNDGIHDFWEIKNLFTYPNCRIQVFTRTGQLVFESVGYPKPWDGNYKGKPLPFDTYYYIMELNNRIATKPITGYVTIVK